MINYYIIINNKEGFERIILFTSLSNKMVKPKKVDTVYKYIGYKLKVVMDNEIFCCRRQRNNS